MKYAITGSTGKFGRTAIETLLKEVDASDIIALARNEEKAKKVLPEGIEIRLGSYEDEETLATSLQGVDRLLFISSQPGGSTPRLTQHTNVINAAKEAGVKFIAYTSFPQVDQATAPLADDHKATEKLIKDSGIDYSFLRNNWYLENDLGVITAGNEGKPFIYSAGNGKAGWALERLYAEAAAKILVLPEPKKIYEFAGPSVTYADIAAAVKEATGKEFEVDSISDEEYSKGLIDSGMDEGTAQVITSLQTLIHDGNLEENTTDLPDVLERPLPSLVDSIKEVLSK